MHTLMEHFVKPKHRRRYLYLFLSAFFIFNLISPAETYAAQSQWKKGVHYDVISNKLSSTGEILYFFSFWSQHCYNLQPVIENIEKNLPAKAKLERVHVNSMAFSTKEVQDDATRALMVARVLDKEQTFVKVLFNYIVGQRRPLESIGDIRELFVKNGLGSGRKFDKYYNSFVVDSLFRKNNNLLEKYKMNLKGIPAFIINGKYQAKFTRGMTPDDMTHLIIWLLQQR